MAEDWGFRERKKWAASCWLGFCSKRSCWPRGLGVTAESEAARDSNQEFPIQMERSSTEQGILATEYNHRVIKRHRVFLCRANELNRSEASSSAIWGVENWMVWFVKWEALTSSLLPEFSELATPDCFNPFKARLLLMSHHCKPAFTLHFRKRIRKRRVVSSKYTDVSEVCTASIVCSLAGPDGCAVYGVGLALSVAGFAGSNPYRRLDVCLCVCMACCPVSAEAFATS
jgi:hypothetical protein